LLPRILDAVERVAAPGAVVARHHCAVEHPVGLHVRLHAIGLVDEKGMRPARRGEQRHAPGAFARDATDRRAEVEAASRRWSRWIERTIPVRPAGDEAALAHDAPAVAVYRYRDH